MSTMNNTRRTTRPFSPAIVCALAGCAALVAPAAQAETALTIYNQAFGVVRETFTLDLKPGENRISFSDLTAHVEPDSVVLRDPSGQRVINIYEQAYRSDPISQELLLSLYEGETIDFIVYTAGEPTTVKGKIIRSGYVPHYTAMYSNMFGQQYNQAQWAYASNNSQPVVEVNGEIRFGLPGQPVFPKLKDDSILKPTLDWVLATTTPGTFEAELAYVSRGMSWYSAYNIVAPETGDELSLVGWVTMSNQSGRTFKDASIKLMAGDVNKLSDAGFGGSMARGSMNEYAMSDAMGQPVTQKSFDEYHLYELARPVSLRDRETKQVEFIRAEHVKSRTRLVYDGAWIDPQQYMYWNADQIRDNQQYGQNSQPKVWVVREFKNCSTDGLGMPLPRGKVRFYRQDDDGRLEFTGENLIDHTPKDEYVRVTTGNAFDVVGERVQTDYAMNHDGRKIDESFRITIRNHKDEPVEVTIVEHLYRWGNWNIVAPSHEFTKKDSRTVEFTVSVPANGEKTVTYTAHYWW